MKSRMMYVLALVAFALLPLVGCSGGDSNPVKSTPKGYEVVLSGQVETGTAKSAAKTVFLNSTTAGANGLGSVFAYDANSGAKLGSASLQSDGVFSNLAFTLPTPKSVVVFKAETKTGAFSYLLPLDLSNPPTTAGLTNNNIQIIIGQASTNQLASVSFDLGLTGKLGDTGVTIPAAKTFTDVVASVLKFGGQVLSYSANGINLGAKLDNPLLPSQNLAAQTADSINDLKLIGKVNKVVIPESGKPIVSFQITDKNGKGVSGFEARHFRPSLVKLVKGVNGSPDQWISYHPKNATDFTRNDSGGSLVNNGDGSYIYYFGTKITDKAGKWAYDETTTNRLAIMVSGTTVTGGAVTIQNPANIIYDFVPKGGEVTLKRDIVTMEACLECHIKFTSFHGGGRQDPAYCVVCHNNSVLGNGSVVDIALGNGNDTKTRAWATEGITDGVLLGDMVTLIHKVHMGKNLKTTGWNWSGRTFKDYVYPQDIRNCEKCHKGSQGNNWNTKPSRQACGSCHDNVNWKTGANTRTNKGGVANTPGWVHEASMLADDSTCVLCHNAASIVSKHALPSNADATKRTMSATITGVTVDAAGKVTANFTVKDGGVAVTDKAKFTAPTFILVKLVQDSNGVLNWVGYTNQYNTKVDKQPILQNKGENDGTLVANADGTFSYTFKLKTAEPEGDIRNVNHAHNIGTPANSIYNSATGNAAWLKATPIPTGLIAYEPTKTHRVAMTFSKFYATGTAPLTGAPGVNAWFDFVPAGGAVKDTRDIVKMANCASCHANQKLHAAFDIQVCVTCHNPGTKDPATGETVSLENIVHKLHMGKDLPSVKAGGTYVINVNHDYSKSAFPASIKNCNVCHVETGNTNGANWRTNPTAGACITCHDGGQAVAHAAGNANQCAVCHGSGRNSEVLSAHK